MGFLQTDIRKLKGVGEQRAKAFSKLDYSNVEEKIDEFIRKRSRMKNILTHVFDSEQTFDTIENHFNQREQRIQKERANRRQPRNINTRNQRAERSTNQNTYSGNQEYGDRD